MASTDIVGYACASTANVLTQGAYLTTGYNNGMSAGIVPSNYFNKAIRQASFMAAGLANFCVNQSVSIPDDGIIANLATNIATAIQNLTGSRTRLNTSTTYFVNSSTGSDSNNGLTSGTAWFSIQHAVNYIQQNVDIGGQTVTIQLADATYTTGLSINSPFFGGSPTNVILQGNVGTPSNVVISTNGTCIAASTPGVGLTVQSLKLTSTTSSELVADQGSYISFNNLVFGQAGTNHISCTNESVISCTGNYTINGNAGNSHINGQYGGNINISSKTITLSGTPAFSTNFATIDGTYLAIFANTFSGSGTGTRYKIINNGVINTAIASAGYLPGNVNGSAISGGIYI